MVGTDVYDYYYNENWQVLEVRKNGSSNPLEQWVWDQRYIDAPVLRWHGSNTDGTIDDTLYATNDAHTRRGNDRAAWLRPGRRISFTSKHHPCPIAPCLNFACEAGTS